MFFAYPSSIKEAANQLDLVKPGWVNDINFKLNMNGSTTCVIGQLFGEYSDGIKKIYNINVFDDGEYYKDSIFGRNANVKEWEKEIEIRKSGKITFNKAVEALEKGHLVTSPRYDAPIKLQNKQFVQGKIVVGIEYTDIIADDWIILPAEFHISEVKMGQKFVFKDAPDNICIRVDVDNHLDKYQYLSTVSWRVYDCDYDILIDKIIEDK